jgi:hypothetical protein
LVTGVAVGGHPTGDEGGAAVVGDEAAARTEAVADGGGVAVLEALDDHEKHDPPTSRRGVWFGCPGVLVLLLRFEESRGRGLSTGGQAASGARRRV